MFSRNRTPSGARPEELRETAMDKLHTIAVSGRVNLPRLGVSHRPSTMTINDAPTQILSPDPPRKKWHQRWSVRIPAGLALLALAGSIGAAADGGSHLAPAAAARPAPSASASAAQPNIANPEPISPAPSSPDFNQITGPLARSASLRFAPPVSGCPAVNGQLNS